MTGKLYLLNPSALKTLPPGQHNDGGGLYLIVTESGGRNWSVRLWKDNNPFKMGLGPLRDVSAKEARAKADKYRKMVRDGLDPRAERRQENKGDIPTFGTFADEMAEKLVVGLKNQKSIDKWKMSLKQYAKPIRDIRIDEVTTDDVVEMLQPLWLTIPVAAREFQGRICRIFSAAKVLGHRQGENPAQLKGHLEFLLPKQPRKGQVRGAHPAMPYAELPAFMAELRQRRVDSVRALMIAILTCTRASETTGMAWPEINFSKQLWTIPKERMKNGKEAKVPLSAPAMAILREIREEGASDKHVFVGRRRSMTISDATMLRLLQRDMGRADCTVHGFRTTFRTWGQEKTEFSREILEHCLHHIEGSETEKAYKRGDALEKRIIVMNAWADYCLKPHLKLVA